MSFSVIRDEPRERLDRKRFRFEQLLSGIRKETHKEQEEQEQ